MNTLVPTRGKSSSYKKVLWLFIEGVKDHRNITTAVMNDESQTFEEAYWNILSEIKWKIWLDARTECEDEPIEICHSKSDKDKSRLLEKYNKWSSNWPRHKFHERERSGGWLLGVSAVEKRAIYRNSVQIKLQETAGIRSWDAQQMGQMVPTHKVGNIGADTLSILVKLQWLT